MAFYQRDGSWIVRGGSLISATGALTLFAEWLGEAELARRRRLAADYVLRSRETRGTGNIPDEKIAEVLDSELHKLRLPIVCISAGLLTIGSILQAIGDLLLGPTLRLADWIIRAL